MEYAHPPLMCNPHALVQVRTTLWNVHTFFFCYKPRALLRYAQKPKQLTSLYVHYIYTCCQWLTNLYVHYIYTCCQRLTSPYVHYIYSCFQWLTILYGQLNRAQHYEMCTPFSFVTNLAHYSGTRKNQNDSLAYLFITFTLVSKDSLAHMFITFTLVSNGSPSYMDN